MEIIKIENTTFSYPEALSPALNDVNLTVEVGEWVVLCGQSGCGKTTLLRHLKPALTPHGKRSGQVFFDGCLIEKSDERKLVEAIGYVSQRPDNQIVTDKVWHEMAFAMECLGYPSDTIRLRVAEMASFFGITQWFYKSVHTLSGGQKQLLNLAGVMTLSPKILVLDEPLSQLDPIAAKEFLSMLKRINQELGVSIVMSEHRLEEVLPLADRMVVMESGRIIADDTVASVGKQLYGMRHVMRLALTSPMRFFNEISHAQQPVTVKEGKRLLNTVQFTTDTALPEDVPIAQNQILTLKEVYYQYDKEATCVLSHLSMSLCEGAFNAILGTNGAGKSTLLKVISGIYKPTRGRLKFDKSVSGGVVALPQDPTALFTKKTVREELEAMGTEQSEVEAIVGQMHLKTLLSAHPFDLSGGEAQRLALGKVLLTKPKLLLLDEPTKGLDEAYKRELGERLLSLREAGLTILMVSHDVEFCARYTDRCALLFNGELVTEQPTRQFFKNNYFYTTVTNRLLESVSKEILTVEEAVAIAKANY
ncbi:ABC transporter ATP-binding protein [Fusibacter sp. JL298sf-3]